MQKREHEFGRRWNDTWQVEDIKTSTMRAPVEPNRTPEGLHSFEEVLSKHFFLMLNIEHITIYYENRTCLKKHSSLIHHS